MRLSRVRWVLAGAIAALLAGGGVVVADVVGTPEKPLEFQLISRATAINNFVLQDPARFSVGDRYVFSDAVFRPSAHTMPVGKFEGQCTLVDPATAHWDCAVVTTLPEGTIRGAGSLTFVEGSINKGAVVGGTGRYRNARGEGTVELGPFEGPHRLSYSLILNP
jgi:hypothetical protein